MKSLIHIFILFCLMSIASANTHSPSALDWYGYDTMLSYSTYENDNMIDDTDDNINRKRRHRRRRKISPPKKGW